MTSVWSLLLKGLCLKNQGQMQTAEDCFRQFTAGQCFCVTGFTFTNACSVSGWCLRCFVSLTVKRSWSLIITWFLTLCWRWVSCTLTRGGRASHPFTAESQVSYRTKYLIAVIFSWLQSDMSLYASCKLHCCHEMFSSCQEKLQGVLNGVSYAVQGPCGPHQT